jgi:competence protein ComEC
LLVPATPFLVATAVGGNHTTAAPATTTTPAQHQTEHAAGADIDYVDVGQGDGVVMRIGGQFIVSDAGQHNVAAVDAALHQLGATETIDVAILSHPHSDHVKNVLALADTYGWTIKTVALSHSDWWEGTDTNRTLIAALEKHGAQLTYVSAGQHFTWGGADWEILSPPEGKYTGIGQAADSSVVYVLREDGDRFLFTGDIGKSVASTVAKRWTSEQLGQATVFLATHHGSAAGSTDELLQAITPRWAVLSTGKNAYGHPSAAAIKRLEQHGVAIWCTNTNGTIRALIATDGQITWVANRQQALWWSPTPTPGRETGSCVGK